mmetsp:Transcript_51569/g.116059  ORF Transcript_51569/g.116059 Transcript_51569/m.116059 type:complete len:252 (+) Transcript_51569:461-1216(+)
MKEPSISCSSPRARIALTAAAEAICTKPRLLGRRRMWHCGSLCCRTVEWATSTRATWPYMEKCCFSFFEALKPSLLIRRTMKRQFGSSEERTCRLDERVCTCRAAAWRGFMVSGFAAGWNSSGPTHGRAGAPGGACPAVTWAPVSALVPPRPSAPASPGAPLKVVAAAQVAGGAPAKWAGISWSWRSRDRCSCWSRALCRSEGACCNVQRASSSWQDRGTTTARSKALACCKFPMAESTTPSACCRPCLPR